MDVRRLKREQILASYLTRLCLWSSSHERYQTWNLPSAPFSTPLSIPCDRLQVSIACSSRRMQREQRFTIFTAAVRLCASFFTAIIERSEANPPQKRYDCLTFRQLSHVSRQTCSIQYATAQHV